jgi:hypothetical protein
MPDYSMIYTTALIFLLVLMLISIAHTGLYLPSVFALGVLLGLVLYLSRFGFASTYRNMMLYGETEGIRAQLVMLMLATLLFVPILAAGKVFGTEATGAIAPLGLQVVAGAFLFGMGMQLGGGCGSGTLYALGGGSLRMVITLAAFVAGSFWASLHMGWWQTLPSIGVWSIGDRMGWELAVVLQLTVLVGLFLLIRGGKAAETGPVSWRTLLSSPWTLMQGAVALALLNTATLIITGHPWTITWAFTLWGAKLAMLTGWTPESHAFWQGGFQLQALNNSMLHDETSLMNFGIVLGALLAALFSHRMKWVWEVNIHRIAASLIGGIAMGYGARIAFGCNIGAFFSGVASTSLHGWLWIFAALAGTWIGIRLRPSFGLAN